VKGTPSFGTFHVVGCTLDLVGHTYSDWVGDGTNRNSTFGYVLSFGSGPICWSSKKQSVISLSFAEAEYKKAMNETT
jgi:KUP system potassium uptake protein